MSGLNVGLVTPYDLSIPGGVNSHVFGLAAELRRHGCDVSIIGPASRPWSVDQAAIPVGSAMPIPVAGSLARLCVNPAAGLAVRRVLREREFDIVHLHEPFLPIVSFSALLFSESVNVGTFHLSRDRPHLLYLACSPLLRRLNERLSVRIAVSPAARETVARFIPGRYEVVPNGIDVDRFPYDGGEPAGQPTILFLGRIEERKGLDVLLAAFLLLQPAFPEVQLLIGGDGPGRARAEAFAQSHALANVRFLGRVPDADLPALYRSATVFCSPALENESFGIVLVEAMASGTPVVASANAGHRSILTDGRDGLLAPPGDAAALSHALAEALHDPRLRARLAQAGRARARDFSWSRVGETVLAYYDLALRSAPQPAGVLAT